MYLKPTDEQRLLLSTPVGRLIKGTKEDVVSLLAEEGKNGYFGCVGDVVSGLVVTLGLQSLIYIVDCRVERQSVPLAPNLCNLPRRKIVSPPGHINTAIWPIISSIIDRRETTLVLADGEEDLLMLPLIDLAPEGSKMLYGQPSQGVVIVDSEPRIKKSVRSMLRKMSIVDSPK